MTCKGEFTGAVIAWMKNVESKYPTYTAFTRDVNLSVENGKTDSLKVGSVVKRELTVAAAISGVILGSPINGAGRPFESLQKSRRDHQPTNRRNNSRPKFLEYKPRSFPGSHALSPAPSLRMTRVGKAAVVHESFFQNSSRFFVAKS